MLTLADKEGKGVSQMLTLAEKSGITDKKWQKKVFF